MRIQQGDAGWAAIDALAGVPRFDTATARVVVDRLLQAAILESVPGAPDRIRFVFEAVQDYFLAENDAAAVAADPQGVALALAEGPFSSAYIRLDRLGKRIVGNPVRDSFLDALSDLDPVRAAVLVTGLPPTYMPGAYGRRSFRVSRRGSVAGFVFGPLSRPTYWATSTARRRGRPC